MEKADEDESKFDSLSFDIHFTDQAYFIPDSVAKLYSQQIVT